MNPRYSKAAVDQVIAQDKRIGKREAKLIHALLKGPTMPTIIDTTKPRSWKPEVQADSSGKWYPNGLAFATQEEAEAYARDLSMRWLAVRETRSVASDEPVNYSYRDGKLADPE